MIIHGHIGGCNCQGQIGNGAAVGRNYDNACQSVNINNGYLIDFLKVPLFVPSADGTMSCETLQMHYDELKYQIQGWRNRMVSANREERQNITCVLNTQEAKLAEYQARLIDCNKIPSTETYTNTTETGEHQTQEPPVVETDPGATTEGNDNTGLWLMALGVTGFAIYRMRKNKKRRQTK